ncbi:YciI family protein [Cohnella soli]|uniref:YciI family protein n=1 Tax=Cohnella soli TaxID=425005 RepID=A0ABW0I6D5_9BACL
MSYTLMFYESQEDFAARTDPARQQEYLAGWAHYVNALRQAGIVVYGSGLFGPETAVTMKRHGGETMVQDGPFSETKEQLGGIMVIDVPDVDTAMEWAARAPVDVVEVRQNIPAL